VVVGKINNDLPQSSSPSFIRRGIGGGLSKELLDLYNNPDSKELRKYLRANVSKAEQLLWSK